jgi:glycosyltransferase involved in cell wall biosynthesis
MSEFTTVDVVIPALNEEQSLPLVLAAIVDPRVRHVVVVDNGSTDATAQLARDAGAIVVTEPQRGYGSACLAGLSWLSKDPPDIVAFVDADFSDHPEELGALLREVELGADLVIGSRTTGGAAPGALLPQARFGNWLATRLVRSLYGVEFTDLGPFRVIRWPALVRIGMQDVDFGWTVEMQVKAAKHGLICTEIPVRYRERIGVSKITGTLNGTVRAGHKILWTIFRERYLG